MNTMRCSRIRGAVLVVALLFSPLLTLYLPTARARHVVALEAKDGLNMGGGRQHMVGDDAGKTISVAIAGGSRRVRRVEMRVRAARRHRRDAADEVHDMLRRDYAWRARRRRPIHNDEPHEDEP